jgi:glyoxylase-like metal-dependent hydrolase (beta-lactamase superfamily II)
MSEPKAVAENVEEVVPGIWHWFVWDERIGAESHAHALATAQGSVLIDPLPLVPEALRRLEPVAAICLTAACHQRSAWRYRRMLSVQVHAPEGSEPMEEEPDRLYHDNEALPGGLRAIRTPGPDQAHYAFLREQPPPVLFTGDLVMPAEGGDLQFAWPEYQEDPEATKASVEKLAALPFGLLCMAHGAPIVGQPAAALRALLRRVT